MIFTRHSHCFSKSQLEIIIDGYLSLAPYYTVLLKALKNSTQKYEQKPDPHRTDKAHPIRVYTRDYQCSKNILDDDGENGGGEPRTDLRSTYASTNIRYFYLFPLEYVIEILESSDFYSMLPQNIIINGLLTATNLDIIIETLAIVSQDMCKKIRITIAGKELTAADPKQDPVIEESHSFASFGDNLSSQQLLSSIVQIQVEDEDEPMELKLPAPQKSNRLIKREIAGTKRFINIDRQIAENQCRFCQGYLIYLYQTVGENPLDEDINRLSVESIRCLNIISKAVPHFTLYLSNINQIHVPNDVNAINKVINPMGLVITEEIFSSELNPKNIKPAHFLHRRPKNLIEELQPYFKTIEKKKRNQNFFSIEELFRMIIYSPTTGEVSEQLKQHQFEEFQKETVSKGYENDYKLQKFFQKECEEMKSFEQERLKIIQHTIDIRPVYKQLQFPDEPFQVPSTKPSNYNVYNPSRTNNHNKNLENERSLTIGINGVNQSQHKVDNKTLMLELSHSISRAEDNQYRRLKKKGSNNGKFKEEKKKKNGDQLNIPEFGTLAMSEVFKKSAIKIHKEPISSTLNNFLTSNNSTIQNLMTTSTQIPESFLKGHSDVIDKDDELSDAQFKKMLYNSFTKRQNISRAESNNYLTIQSPSTQAGQNPSAFISTKAKKNIYSNSMSTFIGRKQEQEQMDCIEKKEKQTFNKQLLNGEFVKNEIYSELKKGTAIVFNDYSGTLSLSDTFKLERRFPTDWQKQEGPSSKVRVPSPSPSSKKQANFINLNSTKFNETGIIRNQKYNKCIKNQLINNRSSFLRANEKENQSRHRLVQTQLKSKSKGGQQNQQESLMNLYQQELKTALEEKKLKRFDQAPRDERSEDVEYIYL